MIYRLMLLALVSAAIVFGQVNTNLSLTTSAGLVGFGPNFTMSGTATLGSLGSGVFSGGGVVSNQVISGSQSGPIPGTFTIIFQNGDLVYGTFSIPSGLIFTTIGGSTGATGNVTVLGGSGRYENARGSFTNISGTGTATSATSANIQVNGNGLFATNYRILSQVAFGGGWYSALYFTNPTSSQVSFNVNFIANDGTPLNVPSLNGSSVGINLAAGASSRIEVPNTGQLVQGYASVNLPDGVTGYGVFRQSVANVPDQEAVVPLAEGLSTTATLTFDDTAYVTAVAIVNPSETAATINVVAKNPNGVQLGTATVNLAARSKTALVLRDIQGLGGVANNRGSVLFSASTGNVTVLGLRFNGTAFTSIPAER